MDSNIIIAVVTGIVSAAGTVAVIKNDIGWLKQSMEEVKARVSELEKAK